MNPQIINYVDNKLKSDLTFMEDTNIRDILYPLSEPDYAEIRSRFHTYPRQVRRIMEEYDFQPLGNVRIREMTDLEYYRLEQKRKQIYQDAIYEMWDNYRKTSMPSRPTRPIDEFLAKNIAELQELKSRGLKSSHSKVMILEKKQHDMKEVIAGYDKEWEEKMRLQYEIETLKNGTMYAAIYNAYKRNIEDGKV